MLKILLDSLATNRDSMTGQVLGKYLSNMAT